MSNIQPQLRHHYHYEPALREIEKAQARPCGSREIMEHLRDTGAIAGLTETITLPLTVPSDSASSPQDSK